MTIKTVEILDKKISASWLQWLFESIAINESEFVETDKGSYINGKIDSLYESLEDETFAQSIIEDAEENGAIIQ